MDLQQYYHSPSPMKKNTGNFVLFLGLALCGISLCAAKCQKQEELPFHEIQIANAMSHTASVRCFRYDLSSDNYLGNKWLKPSEETSFKFRYSLSPETIYYCSTMNGSFVAYRQRYDCAQNEVNLCQWRIHEKYAELYSLNRQTWVQFKYEQLKSPTCYRGLCASFPRGYPNTTHNKAPCHKKNNKN